MKVFVLMAMLSTIAHVCFAQLTVVNTSLINTDANTAIIGVENIFEIKNPAKGVYELASSNSSIIKKTNTPHTFNIHPLDIGADTLSVIQNGSTIYQKIFLNEYLPRPVARLGAIREEVVTKNQVIAGKELIVGFINFKGTTDYNIASFKLHIKSTHLNVEHQDIPVAGNLLSEKAIALIKLLQPGDSIQFDDIKARGNISSETTFPSFTIQIK